MFVHRKRRRMEQTANESYQQVREPPARHAWCVSELKHCNNETWSAALIRCLWSRIVDQTTAALSGDWQTQRSEHGTPLSFSSGAQLRACFSAYCICLECGVRLVSPALVRHARRAYTCSLVDKTPTHSKHHTPGVCFLPIYGRGERLHVLHDQRSKSQLR